MLERIRKRARSRSISISLDLLEKIEKVCNNDISVSSFIKLAVIKELEQRGIG
ncbi:hypothetical protein HZA96_05295 [Candidatus Woesearchaeota archaeon]|nr:hypothetical protein [Candidatus Woesearchaeota archaeon]